MPKLIAVGGAPRVDTSPLAFLPAGGLQREPRTRGAATDKDRWTGRGSDPHLRVDNPPLYRVELPAQDAVYTVNPCGGERL